MLKRKQATVYVVSVLALSSFITGTSQAVGNLDLSILAVFTPSLLAFVMVLKWEGVRGVKDVFLGQLIKPFQWTWLLVALLLFPVIGSVAIKVHSIFGGPNLALRSTQVLPQVIVILLISFGEEFGWRGYLLPRLKQKYSGLQSSLIVGLVWALWHFPAYLIGTGVPQEMSFFVFLVWVVAASVLMGWVYLNTGSVFLAIVMHSMANLTFNYLPLLPEFVGQIRTFLLFLGIVIGLTVVVGWRFGAQRFHDKQVCEARR